MSVMKNLSSINITAGMRFSETNLAIMTVGSKIQEACMPDTEKVATSPRMKNLIQLKFLFVESPGETFFFPRAPVTSIAVPRGHIQPQKNLPKIKVKNSIIKEKYIPGRMDRSLIEVKIIIKGSILKKVEGDINPSRG